MARILIIDGQPDPSPQRYVHALAQSYAQGARAAGHDVNVLTLSSLDFPLLRTAEDYQHGTPPPAIHGAQSAIVWAEHIVILFPLWLGSMPALLKGFLEQVLRPDFAYAKPVRGRLPRKLLAGKSARIVVTMGMPALFYSLVYRAHSLKSLERNILGFCGIGPIRVSLIGMVEGMKPAKRRQWLEDLGALGRRAR